MSEAYSEVSAYVAGLTLPVDTELATMTTLKPVLTRIADRTKFLLDALLGSVAGDSLILQMSVLENLNSRFVFTGPGSTIGWIQSNISDQGRLWFGISLPKGVSKIQGIRASVDGNGGGVSHANLPATLPNVRLHWINVTTGAISSEALTADTPANLAAYEVPHTFGSTTLNHTVDPNNQYFAQFMGETGADSAANALLLMRMAVLIDP